MSDAFSKIVCDVTDAMRAKRGSPYLTSKQAAFYLSLSDKRLQTLRRIGGGPVFLRVSGSIRYHIRDLVAFAKRPDGSDNDLV